MRHNRRDSVLIIFILFYLQSIYASSMVYVPSHFNLKKARVLVVIHGCLQSPEYMALGTGWNEVADKNSLVVIYPKVPASSNAMDCWNWFLPENQSKKAGQLKLVTEEVKTWKKKIGIEQAPVVAIGISSGAATVAGLLACFPKEYAAGVIHSGPSYATATNFIESEQVLKHGPNAQSLKQRECDPAQYQKPVMVIHGGSDPVVNIKNVEQIVADFMFNAALKAEYTHAANGLKYHSKDYYSENKLRGRVVIVDGLGHAWSGYGINFKHPQIIGPSGKIPTRLPFFLESGPSSTHLIFDFINTTTK